MGKVSNPYNFNPKDDYRSYAELTSPITEFTIRVGTNNNIIEQYGYSSEPLFYTAPSYGELISGNIFGYKINNFWVNNTSNIYLTYCALEEAIYESTNFNQLKIIKIIVNDELIIDNLSISFSYNIISNNYTVEVKNYNSNFSELFNYFKKKKDEIVTIKLYFTESFKRSSQDCSYYYLTNNNIDITEINNSEVEKINALKPKYISCLTYGCNNLSNINLNTLDTSNLKDSGRGLFFGCKTTGFLTFPKIKVNSLFCGFSYCELPNTIINDNSFVFDSETFSLGYCFYNSNLMYVLLNFGYKNIMLTSTFYNANIKTISISGHCVGSLSEAFCGLNANVLYLNDLDTSEVTSFTNIFASTKVSSTITVTLDLSSARYISYMFNSGTSFPNPIHLKNVPKNLDFSNIGGIEGTHYIIDNYKL